MPDPCPDCGQEHFHYWDCPSVPQWHPTIDTPPSSFDLASRDCGELFNAITHITSGRVDGPVYFTARMRIAAAVFDTIIAAGQREADAFAARCDETVREREKGT